MKLLVVNPNISESVSALIAAEARRVAAPDTQITMQTAAFGVAYIETRFEAMIGAMAVAELAGTHVDGHDALVIAAFGDPGLLAMREVLDIPVVGLTESAVLAACALGQRFSIIAISKRIAAWYEETVASYGLAGRLASIRTLDQTIHDIGAVQKHHAQALKALCMQAITEDRADVLIIAGAPLAGLARTIEPEIPVPVIDGVSCAIRQAESLVKLGARPPRASSLAPPPRKPNHGLSQALRRLLER